ncbi:MAG TPA: hypothetical protein VN898_06505, partial [Candidatus Binatia bacterium]|nr:hypothetical protein [Candidatus Binatia bacterium]
VTDRACAGAAGTFRGPNTTCPPVPACPVAPSNDECANAIAIPYTFTSGFEPPADNTNATNSPWFRPPSQQDPPYSCSDHKVFSGPYGSGTIWYSYTVPTGGGRSIILSTQKAAQFYPLGGGAGDTRIAMYFSSSGTCSTLQEVACADNIAGDNSWSGYYAPLRYNNPAPGKYYIQLSTVFNVDRGRTYLTVTDPAVPTTTYSNQPRIPAVTPWGIVFMTLVLLGAGAALLRLR